MRKYYGAWLLLGMTGFACVGMASCGSDAVEDEEDETEEDGGLLVETGADAPIDRRPPRDAAREPDATLSDAADAGDAKNDADAGDAKKEADAGIVYAPTGSPCGPIDKTQVQVCGICGQRYRVCQLPPDAAADADLLAEDAGIWQEWGICQNEVDGGCMAGSFTTCGRCGVSKCTNDCKPSGVCTDAGPCWPGDIDFFYGLSCDAGMGKERQCDDSCQWSLYGECQFATDDLVISENLGGHVAKRFKLEWPPDGGYYLSTYSYYNYSQGLSAYYTCPGMSVSKASGTVRYPYKFIEVKNPTSERVLISTWTAYADGGIDAGTTYSSNYYYMTMWMTVYETRPEDDDVDARARCTGLVVGGCDGGQAHPTACPPYYYFDAGSYYFGNWPGLMKADGRGVVIEPNSSVWIYVQLNDPWSQPTYNEINSGEFQLAVKTEAFAGPDGGF